MVVSPDDWSDVEAWNAYHSASSDRRSSDLETGLRFVPALRERGVVRVWFPGSGTSLVPRAYAELGFDVLSTDFSEVAVGWQRAAARSPLPSEAEAKIAEHRNGSPPGVMQVEQHDFRQPLSSPPFDLIFNVRAFQGLEIEAMHAAARTHSAALRIGGWAIFDTMNVQGTRRDDLEDALISAGFVIPFHETERWYRGVLRATGIPFAMVLGQPVAVSDARTDQDRATLRAFSTEYHARMEAEAKQSESRWSSPTVKIAHVVYSTG